MMTSETGTFKTNEFLRRRKLRIQQVREQSKDVAKSIRQRVKAETLKQVFNLDAEKQKAYFDSQEKLVKHLEVLYQKGVNNVGASHQSASQLTQGAVNKTDISKLRGKEAAAALRKRRQEKLDEQKKILDRKLQAREAANELSREKSSLVANKLLVTNTAPNTCNVVTLNPASATEGVKENNKDAVNFKDDPDLKTKNDRGTEQDVEEMSLEKAVSDLSLPKDDLKGLKITEQLEKKAENSKRLDLFALSKEMPADLCGRQVDVSEKTNKIKPSLTLVTEYLQSRKLRLRESEARDTKNKHSDDISNLKETILRTRPTKPEGSSFNMCQVLDTQAIPVPSWHAERNCDCCTHNIPPYNSMYAKQLMSLANSEINGIFISTNTVKQTDMMPNPILRSTSPFRRNKINKVFSKKIASAKLSACTENSKTEGIFKRKPSVVIYSHCTRDTRDLPQSNEHLVVRDLQTEEDAYTQALTESSAIHTKDRIHKEKVQERQKAAVTKQAVEKEYRDTINFLNSLSKTGNTKTVYMNEQEQQKQKNNRQNKMQHKYREIEKECRRHHSLNIRRSKSKSPSKQDEIVDDFDSKDYLYSWLPVPESDGNLAIHTIPNTVKEGKSGNSVKFCKVDNYHEYRSRHKHTPPTKDTASQRKHSNRNLVEAVDTNDSNEESSFNSVKSSSSAENLQLNETSTVKQTAKLIDPNLSDAERIIIYKILDTKNCKRKNKLLSNIAKSLTSIEKIQKSALEDNHSKSSRTMQTHKEDSAARTAATTFMCEQTNEGIYKTKEDIGDHISSNYYCPESKGLNGVTEGKNNRKCQHKKLSEKQIRDKGTILEWQDGDEHQTMRSYECCQCSTAPKEMAPQEDKKVPAPVSSSVRTSTSSFKTATNDKENCATTENGHIKLVDDTGQETAKFFLDGTGILKELAYEVVIQLRKKDGSKEEEKEYMTEVEKEIVSENKPTENVQSMSSVEKKSDIVMRTSPVMEGNEINEVLTSRSFPGKESIRNSPLAFKQSNTSQAILQKNVIDQETECQNDLGSNNDGIRLLKSCEEVKDTIDNGTMTQHNLSLNHSYIPSKSAKTTHTQTTTTPIHRSGYIHKSSSTSTTYMSPPEMVLPKFLKRDSGWTDNDTSYVKDKTSDKYINKIKYPRKTLSSTKKHKINDSDYDSLVTPPNTARSCRKHKYLSPPGKCRYGDNTSRYDARIDHVKCKCCDCVRIQFNHNLRKTRHKNCNICCEVNRQAQKRHCTSKNLTPKNKNKFTRTGQIKNSSKDSLNPIIKNYINKLLNLNKDGLRVLEVAEQECSSVMTPSSSIINVPCNVDERMSPIGNKISLEHVQKRLLTRVISDHLKKTSTANSNRHMYNALSSNPITQRPRRKVLHKVKSVNISKHFIKKHNTEQSKRNKEVSLSTTTDYNKGFVNFAVKKSKIRSHRLHTPRQSCSGTSISTYKHYDSGQIISKPNRNKSPCSPEVRKKVISPKHLIDEYKYPIHNALVTNSPPELKKEYQGCYKNKTDAAINISTQTSQNNDTDFVKLTEDKFNNMEKIADLTEKCTKRLSSLARVLDEVRKNKTLAYSQISGSDTADSQSDHKSDKVAESPVHVKKISVVNSSKAESVETVQLKIQSDFNCSESNPENKIMTNEQVKANTKNSSYLADIPKPAMYKLIGQAITTPDITQPISESPLYSSSIELVKLKSSKPPAALSRIQLKHGQEYIVPHELSTVVEVDSPLSIKNKNLSSRNNVFNSSQDDKPVKCNGKSKAIKCENVPVNPDLLLGNTELSKQLKFSYDKSSDDSNFKMIDLKHFNEIMLEPFISIHEYAKKYNVTTLDQESKIEDQKADAVMDDIDISSLHSDGSLPDVIAELLKRNVITEPFKFDTASNINSTTVSSDSTLSMLALSKARKNKKKSNVVFQNKENMGETSDSLSMSSNPDLENSFKKLGMGWASSTLKKTKERLALSSSSNTSSSSLSQFKIKSLNYDIPVLVTDSVSSVYLSKKMHNPNLADSSKNAKQQTNFTRTTTVKEFLTNELANKITFTTNKSGVNNTEEEFASLLETKMPEAFKQRVNNKELSNDSIPSATNRARTSTPVQLFKSMTYHSSSCTNISNGLFSNADDLSSVKMTSNSAKNHSTSDDLTIPNFSLKMKKVSENSKSD